MHLYISSDLNYKVRNDLKIYKAKELESVFVEIINKDKKNYIIGCIYKHPKMLTHEFNDRVIPILEKIYPENKEGYVMGDFNINLINYETDNTTSHFLDNICSNSFFPYINIPTRHTSWSKTFIDNILHNDINANTISGNITTDISDHLAQYLITSYQVHSETKPKKILTKSFKSFVQDNFKYDLQSWLGIHPRHSPSWCESLIWAIS